MISKQPAAGSPSAAQRPDRSTSAARHDRPDRDARRPDVSCGPAFPSTSIQPAGEPMPAMVAARTSDRDHRTERNCDVWSCQRRRAFGNRSMAPCITRLARGTRLLPRPTESPAPERTAPCRARSLAVPEPGEARWIAATIHSLLRAGCPTSVSPTGRARTTVPSGRNPQPTNPRRRLLSRECHLGALLVCPGVQAEIEARYSRAAAPAFRPVGRRLSSPASVTGWRPDTGHPARWSCLVTEIPGAQAIPTRAWSRSRRRSARAGQVGPAGRRPRSCLRLCFVPACGRGALSSRPASPGSTLADRAGPHIPSRSTPRSRTVTRVSRLAASGISDS